MDNRISRLLRRPLGQRESSVSNNLSNTFEVPLFMSRSQEHTNQPSVAEDYSETVHSDGSLYDGIDSTMQPASSHQPHFVRSSSVYSNSPVAGQRATISTQDYTMSPVSEHCDKESISKLWDLQDQTSPRVDKQSRQQRRRKRVSQATLRRMHVKARLSIAFGLTLLLSLIVYIAMAATGSGSGTMFHVLCIMLILGLTGVFGHSYVSLVILMRRKRIRVRGRGKWWGFNEHNNHQSSIKRCNSSTQGLLETSAPSKPIPIIMVADEEAALEAQNLFGPIKMVRPPPPVYGNFRGSTRIDPELVHFQQSIPSPTTPTYDQAMRQAQQAAGYQPPQYPANSVGSVPCRQSNVHPLERERLFGLMKGLLPNR